jgi:tyrosinase
MKFLSIPTTILISSLAVFNPGGNLTFAHNGIDHGKPVGAHGVRPNHNNEELEIRKSVSDLTPSEIAALVHAIKTLKTTIPEGSQISVYDQFVAVHLAATRLIHNHDGHSGEIADLAHENSAFLPWHREYILRFEDALQTVAPNVTLPYWDWTDPEALDVIFSDDFMGSNGQGATINIPGMGSYTGGVVQTGAFSVANGWVLDPRLNIDTETGRSLGTSLVRFLQVPPANNYPLSKEDSDRLLTIDDYSLFRTALEGFIYIDEEGNITRGGFTHNYIHGLVGGVQIEQTPTGVEFKGIGTLSNIPSSPYDPVFWLLHSNVDRIWAQWQDNGRAGSTFYPSEGLPMGQNLNDPMFPWDAGMAMPEAMGMEYLISLLPTVAPNDLVRPIDVLEHRKLGYTYAASQSVPEPNLIYGLGAMAILTFFHRAKEKT